MVSAVSVARKRKKRKRPAPAAKRPAKTFNRDAIRHSLKRILTEIDIINDELSDTPRNFLETMTAVVSAYCSPNGDDDEEDQ